MNRYINISIIIILAVFMASCKKDSHKSDGGTSKAFVNMTTYDFLKSQPVFDSLVKVIDHAGMKDAVNGDITFFATTNYGVAEFIAARKFKRAAQLNDENITYSIDSLSATEMKDSLKTYMFAGKINRDQITVAGKLYNSVLGPIPDIQFLIKFRRTQDYSNYLNHVDYVQLTKVFKTRDDLEPDPKAVPALEKDMPFDCQTSGIITTTGIVHVLHGAHRLFFNTEQIQ